jgi:hypothetical protein
MSIESDRNRIAQIERERSQIASNLHREKENIKKKTTDINNINRSVNKSTSQSMLQSKQRQIESKEREILSCEKRIIDFEKRISAKDSDKLKLITKIEKDVEREKIKKEKEHEQKQKKLDRDNELKQRKSDTEQKRRRDTELRHKKEMTRELEKQNNLHQQLSKDPIVIEFEKLPEKIIVLFIASNPTNQSQLKLDEEIRSITTKIRESKYRDSVELKSIWATQPMDLLQAINEHKPTIVHFSGHGSSNDELVLQNDIGIATTVSLDTIVAMFKVVSSGIKLVVFNTCYSKNQASIITEHIPCAIGMNTAIGDRSAMIFSSQLYSAIGFGNSIENSYNQAKVAMMLEKSDEENTPELYIQDGINSNEIVLVKPEET